jgi:hypothetical protein
MKKVLGVLFVIGLAVAGYIYLAPSVTINKCTVKTDSTVTVVSDSTAHDSLTTKQDSSK